MTNVSSKDDVFSIQPSGKFQMNRIFRLFNEQFGVTTKIIDHLFVPYFLGTQEEVRSDINDEKSKRKKWEPPKFKVSQKDLADLPEDSEVTQSIISSDEQNYFLSFLPQTEKSDISMEPNKTTDRLLSAGPSTLDEDTDLVPESHLPIDNLTSNEKIEKLTKQLNLAYKKNATLARKNKSLRLQFYAACKKTLSQKAKMEVAKDVLKPFFTPTQIDCFCRPSWLRSRNWAEEDFQIALALRKLMSKKAFGYLRKKRMVPMPSLTSLRKYNKMKGIVLQHNTMRTSGSRRSTKATKTSTKNQAAVKGSNIIMSNSATNHKVISKQTSLGMVDSSLQKQDGQTQQPPILFTSSGELGNVEFLQQTVDEQSGNVITTSLPMMTTSDGTTVVQLSTNTEDGEEGMVNYANGQTVQMVMVDPNNPNQFTLQQHPIVVTSTASSTPVATLNLGESSGQNLQQTSRSMSRIKNNDGETWKFIQIG